MFFTALCTKFVAKEYETMSTTPSSIQQLVELLEQKVISLKERVTALKNENRYLGETVTKLQAQQEEFQNEIQSWEEKYNSLKVAGSILGSSEHKTEAKLKINTLIKEIDACIVQLSE